MKTKQFEAEDFVDEETRELLLKCFSVDGHKADGKSSTQKLVVVIDIDRLQL